MLTVGRDRGLLVLEFWRRKARCFSSKRIRQARQTDRRVDLHRQRRWLMRLCQTPRLLVFDGRIDQYHPSDLIRVLAGVTLHVGPAERVADQHVGSSDPSFTKQSV